MTRVRSAGPETNVWGAEPRMVTAVAHNVSTRYLAYLVDAVLGLVMLPFNLSHLGMAAYGLWVLTASFTAYLTMLDLGYGGALVRFVAQYRARRNPRALNEVLSTLSVVYTAIAAVTYGIVILIASNLELLTRLTPAEASTSRTLLLIIGANVALRFVFGIYGGVIVGFQRYHLNNITSIATSLAVAGVNVAILLAGHGVVALVAATTAVRVIALLLYRLNARRVFPGLALDWRLFRRERLREVTGFSVFMLVLDGAYKVNYSTDVVVIGALLGAPAVALWAPAQRLTEVVLRLSNQLSDALFPVVVDCDTSQREARLQRLFVEGTRLSLATVLPIAGGVALLASPLLIAWIGQGFAATASVLQILAWVVIVRVGSSTASIVLKGAGLHGRLTALVGGMAIANIVLSLALIGRLGLVGVAVGTALPVTLVSAFGLVPTACRRVGLSLTEMIRLSLWPAMWPGAVTGALLFTISSRIPPSLPAVALQFAMSCLVYFSLFLVAVGSAGRREYLRQIETLLKRRPQQMSRVGTANAS